MDGLGSFGNGVLCQLSRKNETNRSLNFSGRDRWLLVVQSKLGGLRGELLKDIVDERVHDAHGLGGNSGIRVDLRNARERGKGEKKC